MNNLLRAALRVPKHAIEKALNVRIIKQLPRGLDFIDDIRPIEWPDDPSMILDVGANVGQSALPLSRAFPSATIHCFEPEKENFEFLTLNTRSDRHIRCHHVAVSNFGGTGTLELSPDSTMHHLTSDPRLGTPTQQMIITTVDNFCKDNEIDHINILKIDTEGNDLNVIKGSHLLLTGQSIDVIYCEVSMNTYNKYHASFGEVTKLLASYGYLLFGVYEQTSEWIDSKMQLRRANIALVSSTLARVHT